MLWLVLVLSLFALVVVFLVIALLIVVLMVVVLDVLFGFVFDGVVDFAEGLWLLRWGFGLLFELLVLDFLVWAAFEVVWAVVNLLLVVVLGMVFDLLLLLETREQGGGWWLDLLCWVSWLIVVHSFVDLSVLNCLLVMLLVDFVLFVSWIRELNSFFRHILDDLDHRERKDFQSLFMGKVKKISSRSRRWG